MWSHRVKAATWVHFEESTKCHAFASDTTFIDVLSNVVAHNIADFNKIL